VFSKGTKKCGNFLLQTQGFKEKFGRKIKCEDSEEVADLPIADTSQTRPETKTEDSAFLLQTHECGGKLGKETCNMEQKLEPSEALANRRSADILRLKPQPCSIPSTMDNGSDEGLQDKQVSVATMSKVRLIIETDSEELISTTQIKSSSCTRLTISGNGCYPIANDRSENENVLEGVKEDVKVRRHSEGVKATPQGEGEDVVELPVNVLKIVQENVSEDVQLPATKDVPRVDTPTRGEELSRVAASKKKFASEDGDCKISSKRSKFYWSQDVAVQSVGIISSPSTGEGKA
jgi:hypothetical protein